VENVQILRFMVQSSHSNRSVWLRIIAWSGSLNARFVLHEQRGAAGGLGPTDGRATE